MTCVSEPRSGGCAITVPAFLHGQLARHCARASAPCQDAAIEDRRRPGQRCRQAGRYAGDVRSVDERRTVLPSNHRLAGAGQYIAVVPSRAIGGEACVLPTHSRLPSRCLGGGTLLPGFHACASKVRSASCGDLGTMHLIILYQVPLRATLAGSPERLRSDSRMGKQGSSS